MPRSEETENERLLREAGLLDYQRQQQRPDREPEPPEPFDPYAGTYPAHSWLGAYTRTMPRPAEWDVYTTADAPQIDGDVVEFATLLSGDVIVDVEQGDADLSPLAEAVEKHLKPPYRATGRREQGALWAVAARRIDVRQLPPRDGDVIDLVIRDGEPDPLGLGLHGDHSIHAERLDGDLWEIQVGDL